MRRAVYCMIGICLTAASCSFEVSDNGKLDGFWQMKSVDTLSTGGSADLRLQELSWAFQGKALELRNAKVYHDDILMTFSHKGHVLSVSNPIRILRDSGDVVITDVEEIRHFGVNNLKEQFNIVTLNGSTMILQTDSLRLNFRKY